MKVCFDVSPTGVTTRGLRLRCIEAADVRRVHLFTDANGDVGIVVRKSLWRFVHLPADALRDPVRAWPGGSPTCARSARPFR